MLAVSVILTEMLCDGWGGEVSILGMAGEMGPQDDLFLFRYGPCYENVESSWQFNSTRTDVPATAHQPEFSIAPHAHLGTKIRG